MKKSTVFTAGAATLGAAAIFAACAPNEPVESDFVFTDPYTHNSGNRYVMSGKLETVGDCLDLAFNIQANPEQYAINVDEVQTYETNDPTSNSLKEDGVFSMDYVLSCGRFALVQTASDGSFAGVAQNPNHFDIVFGKDGAFVLTKTMRNVVGVDLTKGKDFVKIDNTVYHYSGPAWEEKSGVRTDLGDDYTVSTLANTKTEAVEILQNKYGVDLGAPIEEIRAVRSGTNKVNPDGHYILSWSQTPQSS